MYGSKQVSIGSFGVSVLCRAEAFSECTSSGAQGSLLPFRARHLTVYDSVTSLTCLLSAVSRIYKIRSSYFLFYCWEAEAQNANKAILDLNTDLT